jgi:RHS repeat-associated protein
VLLAAKIWADGEPEPDTWSLIASDDEISFGGAAVAVGVDDDAALDVRVDDIIVTTVDYLRRDALIDDLDGANNNPWNSANWTTSLSSSGNVDIQDNEGRLAIAATSDAARALGTAASTFGDGTVASRFQADMTPDGRVSFWVRGSATWSTGQPDALTDGYRFVVDLDSDTVALDAVVDDTPTSLVSTSFAVEAETAYNVIVQAIGTTLAAKIWADGDPEPGTWTVVATDDQLQTGRVAISTGVFDDAALDVRVSHYYATSLTATGVGIYSAPEGWTPASADAAGRHARVSVWTHVAAAEDDASWVFVLNSSVKAAGVIAAYSGVDTTTPVDTSTTVQTDATTADHLAWGTNTSGSGRLVVMMVAAPTATSYTPPAGMSERADIATSAGDAVTVTLADKTAAFRGSAADATFTAADASTAAAATIALQPQTGDTYVTRVAYTYDNAGRRTSITRPDGTRLDYGYDPTTGLLETITPTYNLADTFTSSHTTDLDTSRWTVTGTGVTARSLGWARLSTPDTANASVAATANITDAADVDVSLTYDIDNSTSDTATTALRLRVNGTNELQLSTVHNGSTLTLKKVVSGTPTSLGTLTRPAGTAPERIRVRLVGSALKAKVWIAGQTEPGSWGLEVTDSAVTAAGDTVIELDRIDGAPQISVDDVTLVDLNAPPAAVATYGYDQDDRLITETLSGGNRTWDYIDGQLTGFDQDLAGGDHDLTTVLTYDTSGRLETETTDAVTTTYTYDNAAQLLDADDGITERAWTYDTLGRWETSTRPEGAFTYTYDDANQLTDADCTAGPCADAAYTYDRAGRRTNEDRGGTGDRTYTYTPSGRLATTQTDDGLDIVTTSRVNDADNHLTQLNTDDGTTTEQNLPTWDPTNWTLLETTTGTDTPVEHIGIANWAASINAGTVDDTPLTWRGDIRGIDADPYGQPDTPPTEPTLGYRGELHTPDQLIHLRNRDYDPTTGQFLTTDPLEGLNGTTTLTDPYHYTNNNPLNQADPFGLRPTDEGFSAKPGWETLWAVLTAIAQLATSQAAPPPTSPNSGPLSHSNAGSRLAPFGQYLPMPGATSAVSPDDMPECTRELDGAKFRLPDGTEFECHNVDGVWMWIPIVDFDPDEPLPPEPPGEWKPATGVLPFPRPVPLTF